jgi:hypothetical protein
MICYIPAAVGDITFSSSYNQLKLSIMKTQSTRSIIVIATLLFASVASMAQTNQAKNNTQTSNTVQMKTYVIEREIPNAGKLTAEQLKGISQTSCGVLKQMGPQIEWLHSYVTGNKIYCVYRAENAELIKEHAKKGGFPANSISEVATVISPATAN